MSTVHPDGLPLPQRYWAIATIALGVTMAVMDGAIANVALPTIARDLNTDAAFSIWIVNGYQLAIMISLLPLAALGEIIGHRRIYLAGMVVFTLASLACAFSHTFFELAAARVMQGFGAAGIMAVNTAVLRFIYPHACWAAASASTRWWWRFRRRRGRRLRRRSCRSAAGRGCLR